MSHSDNLNGRFDDPVNHRVGKTSEQNFPRALDVDRPTAGIALDLTDGMIEFHNKSTRGGRIALKVPLVRGFGFSDRVRVESNASSGHRLVGESGGALATRGQFLPVPCRDLECGGQSPCSMPIQRLHRLNHPNCPTGARRERRVPRMAAPILLSRASDDCVSYLNIICPGGCRQSQRRQANQPDDLAECAGKSGPSHQIISTED